MIEQKIEKLIEEASYKIMERITEFLFGKYFKDFNEEEFNLFLDLISHWFYYNEDFGKLLRSKKYKGIWKKLENKINNMKLPKYLYRGLSFRTKKDRDNYIKTFEHKRKYESWSSSLKIANNFIPGGKYAQNEKYGVMLKINTKDFKNNIIFSLNAIIQNEKDRKLFFEKVLYRHHKHLKEGLNSKSLRKYVNNYDLFSDMHGAIYAIIEDEYVLKAIEPKDKPMVEFIIKDKK